MTPEDLDHIALKMQETVKVTVNGKIDHLTEMMTVHNAKHEEDMVEVRKHIQEVKPYLDSARGVKLLGETGKWIAGVGGAFIVIYLWFTGKI
jgi:hypothetical protein